MDLMSIAVELHLMHGDNRKLADWIEAGKPLTPVMQKYVVDMMRGDLKTGRGVVRTWSQIMRDRSLARCYERNEEDAFLSEGLLRLGIKKDDELSPERVREIYAAGSKKKVSKAIH